MVIYLLFYDIKQHNKPHVYQESYAYEDSLTNAF